MKLLSGTQITGDTFFGSNNIPAQWGQPNGTQWGQLNYNGSDSATIVAASGRKLTFNGGGLGGATHFVVGTDGSIAINSNPGTYKLKVVGSAEIDRVFITGMGGGSWEMTSEAAGDGRLYIYNNNTGRYTFTIDKVSDKATFYGVVDGSTANLRTRHVAAATPTGGASGDILVGDGKIWINDASTWKSVAIA